MAEFWWLTTVFRRRTMGLAALPEGPVGRERRFLWFSGYWLRGGDRLGFQYARRIRVKMEVLIPIYGTALIIAAFQIAPALNKVAAGLQRANLLREASLRERGIHVPQPAASAQANVLTTRQKVIVSLVAATVVAAVLGAHFWLTSQ